MFERFTDRARRVVVLAQEEARLLDHNYIGTEHLLLGLIHEGDGVAATALQQLGIELDRVRVAVEEIIGRGRTAPEGHVPFTPRAKKVLELSLREAMQLGHNYIGTEHILLGLLREGEGVGAQVLVRFGAELAQVRIAVVELLAGYSTGEAHAEPQPAGARLVAHQYTAAAEEACLLCGRDLWEVDRYVEGTGAAICDVCTAAASNALSTSPDRAVLLPPRVFGDQPADPDAIAAIQEAFSTVFSNGDVAHRVQFLEDGEALAEYMSEVKRRFPEGLTSLQVHGLRFSGADNADVRYFFRHPRAPGPLRHVGRAVRRDGQWLVARETYVTAISRAGVHVPPRSPES